MRTDRRGFLAALIAAPVLARIAPADAGKRVLVDMLDGGPWLRANVWSVGPPLTEERCLRAWKMAPIVRVGPEVVRIVSWDRSWLTIERGVLQDNSTLAFLPAEPK